MYMYVCIYTHMRARAVDSREAQHACAPKRASGVPAAAELPGRDAAVAREPERQREAAPGLVSGVFRHT